VKSLFAGAEDEWRAGGECCGLDRHECFTPPAVVQEVVSR
jgi:hypothetical protein